MKPLSKEKISQVAAALLKTLDAAGIPEFYAYQAARAALKSLDS